MPLVKTPPKLHRCDTKHGAVVAMTKEYGGAMRLWPSGAMWQCDECGWRWKIYFSEITRQPHWAPESRLGHWWRNWRSK